MDEIVEKNIVYFNSVTFILNMGSLNLKKIMLQVKIYGCNSI